MSFKDHFSGHAASYARSRPGYPAALFAWLAQVAPRREHALDCGTGSGQAAVALAAHFARVVATDPSAEQIAHATAAPNVEYRVAPGERSGLPDGWADVVTVAQALHWFDLPRFWPEVERVLAPGGVFAAWTYWLMHVSSEVDATLERFYTGEIAPYWPPERKMVDDGYASLRFPYAPLDVPAFEMTLEWTLDEVLAYLRTWSAVQAFRRETDRDPVAAAEAELAAAWGARGAVRTVRWPLTVRAVRRPA
ncbi:MAG TPA: class I SAM-dependent methyltransferase [Longimicrobiaceae bacterium]|nr:class I SAM-dependent methyltransferase [Longimicrobiaceae bacterium]